MFIKSNEEVFAKINSKRVLLKLLIDRHIHGLIGMFQNDMEINGNDIHQYYKSIDEFEKDMCDEIKTFVEFLKKAMSESEIYDE